MAYDQLMQTYLGVGLLANRPAAPNVKAGVGAFYYATDTAALYVWDGSIWHTLAGGSTTLAGDSDVAIAAPTDGQVLTYAAADGKWENKAAAGGASGALTKLDEVIVGAGGQPNIPFSNIDQSYRSLQIVWEGRTDSTGTQDMRLQLNGDTGANYGYSGLDGTGAAGSVSAFGSAAAASLRLGFLPGTGQTTGMSAAGVVWLPNYRGTTFWKNVLALSGRQDFGSGGTQEDITGTWRSTAAITSILLSPISGNFVQGSVATLYGIT